LWMTASSEQSVEILEISILSSAHRHAVIGPNKGPNKAAAKGPIAVTVAVR
jgi:hypothetical protein